MQIGSSSPETHPFISTEELDYIKDSQEGEISSKKSLPPYMHILKSGAFWILALLNIGFACAQMMHLAIVPEYWYEYVGQPYSKSTQLEFIPYLGNSSLKKKTKN